MLRLVLEGDYIVGYVDNPEDWQDYVDKFEYLGEDIGCDILLKGWE